jgi:hypothetical protein
LACHHHLWSTELFGGVQRLIWQQGFLKLLPILLEGIRSTQRVPFFFSFAQLGTMETTPEQGPGLLSGLMLR